MKHFIILVLFAVVALDSSSELALSFQQAKGTAAKGITIREVNPSDTDEKIDTFTGAGKEHVVYLKKEVKSRGQLVVFLPGTGGNGHGAPKFCIRAAEEGYHVIALTYPSDTAMTVFRNSSDSNAFRKARENIINGKQPYMEFKTTEPNSIENRLTKLVEYLVKTAPTERWNQFQNKKEGLIWSKLVLTGQSQGAGHAGLMATQRKVARVIMFGGPKDHSLKIGKSAAWLSEEKATPLNRFFCFNHAEDGMNGCTYPQQLANYQAMKLAPEYKVVDVDKTSPPYQHSRLLTSTRTVENPHGSVIGSVQNQAAWTYLLTEPVE
jgi:dienelactone hydrolase